MKSSRKESREGHRGHHKGKRHSDKRRSQHDTPVMMSGGRSPAPSLSPHRTDTPTSTSRPPILKKRLQLCDLDAGRRDVTLEIPGSYALDQLAQYITKRFYNDRHLIPTDAQIDFYHGRLRIETNQIPQTDRLYYRVRNGQDEDNRVTVVWDDGNLGQFREQLLFLDLDNEIKDDLTVGKLREMVLDSLLVDVSTAFPPKLGTPFRPDQIEVWALGGLRPGRLKGNSWRINHIQTQWLCRRVALNFKHEGAAIQIQNRGQTFVLHRESPDIDAQSWRDWRNETRSVQRWIADLVNSLDNEKRPGISGSVCDTSDILLRDEREDKPLRDSSTIRWGRRLELRLPADVEEKFYLAQTGFVPSTEFCVVCCEDKRTYEMPGKVTARCGHENTQTCRGCLKEWLASSLEENSWERARCPDCPESLSFEETRSFASKETFARYDKFITRGALTALSGFQWCAKPNCESGFLMRKGCKGRVRCPSCRHSMCAEHQIPWHKGQSCQEYDKVQKAGREKASAKEIKKSSKPCPKCKRPIQKVSGCDHITCVCRHEWCWLCNGEYYHDEQSFLKCRHKKGCIYHGDTPFWEGQEAVNRIERELNGGGPMGWPPPMVPLPPRMRPPPPPPPNFPNFGPGRRFGMDLDEPGAAGGPFPPFGPGPDFGLAPQQQHQHQQHQQPPPPPRPPPPQPPQQNHLHGHHPLHAHHHHIPPPQDQGFTQPFVRRNPDMMGPGPGRAPPIIPPRRIPAIGQGPIPTAPAPPGPVWDFWGREPGAPLGLPRGVNGWNQ